MKPTAAQILQRCKDIVEGRKETPHPFLSVYERRESGYRIEWAHRNLWVIVDTHTNAIDCALAALLLGMDSESEPVPEIVLEWVEDELKYESVAHHAYYNGLIECYISASKDEKARFAWISVNRSRVANMPEKYQHVKTAHEARAWCVEQITKIITPTPKQ